MFSSTAVPKVKKQPQEVFCKKKLFFEIMQYLQENTSIGWVSFK